MDRLNVSTHDQNSVSRPSLPIINAPAPELSTLQEIVYRSVQIRDYLKLTDIVSVLDQALYDKVMDRFIEYFEHIRSSNGQLSRFWMSYIDMMGDIVLKLIRASREGNRELHVIY